MRVEIEVSDGARELFAKLIRRGTNMLPLMQDLGEYLTETTRQRFQTSTAPDGSRWAPNAPATYLAHLGAFKSSFGRDGRITLGGAARGSAKKPLIGETGRLSAEIRYRADATGVEIGSGLVYSAIHQFGGQAGRGRQVNIPARPYLGLSEDDSRYMLEAAAAYLVE